MFDGNHCILTLTYQDMMNIYYAPSLVREKTSTCTVVQFLKSNIAIQKTCSIPVQKRRDDGQILANQVFNPVD